MNTTAKTSKPIENKLVVTSVEGKGRGEGPTGFRRLRDTRYYI